LAARVAGREKKEGERSMGAGETRSVAGAPPPRAIADIEAALAREGESASLLRELGQALLAAGKTDAAAQGLGRSLALDPGAADGWESLGTAFGRLGRHGEAARAFTRAIELDPDIGAGACYGLGNALKALGQNELALKWFEQAVRADPSHIMARSNLGTTLLDLGRVNEGTRCLKEAVERSPRTPELHYNLGNAYMSQRRLESAIESFRRALALAPDMADVHWNLAQALLLTGDFANGWSEYEWRWKLATAGPRREFSMPRWNGDRLDGRTVLVWMEQGFGDAIQFARYISWLADQGGKVVLECWPPLFHLFGSLAGVERRILYGEAPGACDVEVPLISLPLIHRTRFDTIPAQVPYLAADPALVEAWRHALPGDGRRRIGLSWQGNKGHVRDRERSIPLAHFRALLAQPGIQWISLQKEDDSASVADVPATMLPLRPRLASGEGIRDFADTAAIMAGLDLVVSVDSAAGHLAGALGRPAWVLLTHRPEWRWLMARSDSPWYPTMRLFRQPSVGDWGAVLDEIMAALAEANY
jgi:tetratricopeptide (TPR) repeat protein